MTTKEAAAVAGIEEVRATIGGLGAILGGADPELRRKIPDRTVSVWIRDLDVAFSGRLASGELVDVQEIDPDERRHAQLRLAMTSEDLLAIVAGELNFASAWARGRVRVDARFRDVLELRKFL